MVRLLSGRGRETAQWAGAGEVLAVHLSLVAGTHIKEREEPHHGVVPRRPHECCGMNAHAHTHPHTLREKQSFKGIGVGWSFSFLKWYLFVCVTMSVCTCVHVCQGAHEEVRSTFGSGSLFHLWRLRGSCLSHAVWSRLTQAFRDPEDQTQAARPVRQAHFPFPLGCLPA